MSTPAALLARYPLTASLDYDGAIRRVLADWLVGADFELPGHVHDGETPPPERCTLIHPELADGDHYASWPGIVLLDAEGTLTISTPSPVTGTAWPDDDDAPGAQVALRHYADYVVTIRVMVEANDRATRGRLINAVTARLLGHDSLAIAADRYGVICDAGAYYYNRPVRLSPQRLQRADVPGEGGARYRRALLSVECRIPVVYPVALPTLAPPQYTAPTPDEADEGFTFVGSLED